MFHVNIDNFKTLLAIFSSYSSCQVFTSSIVSLLVFRILLLTIFFHQSFEIFPIVLVLHSNLQLISQLLKKILKTNGIFQPSVWSILELISQ